MVGPLVTQDHLEEQAGAYRVRLRHHGGGQAVFLTPLPLAVIELEILLELEIYRETMIRAHRSHIYAVASDSPCVERALLLCQIYPDLYSDRDRVALPVPRAMDACSQKTRFSREHVQQK